MITIFTIPKPFNNSHIDIIQTNAIKSWQKSIPNCVIFLIGNDIGVEEKAKQLQVKYFPDIKRNDSSTPLINSAFEIARKNSFFDRLMFINTDIILVSDFLKIFKFLPPNNFLVVGQRWNIDIDYFINYEKINWEKSLLEELHQKGKLYGPLGSDHFLFEKNSFIDIPSFTVGRIGWDNWMIYEARRKKMITIDSSKIATVIHQKHDYSHLPGGKDKINTNPEALRNIEIAGGKKNIFVLKDANWELTSRGLKKKKFNVNQFKHYLINTPEVLPMNIYIWKPVSLLLLLIIKLKKLIKRFLFI